MNPCVYCGVASYSKCSNCRDTVCSDACSMSHARGCFSSSIPVTCSLCGLFCSGARLRCMHSMHPECVKLTCTIGGCTACYLMSNIGDDEVRSNFVKYIRTYAREGPFPVPASIIDGFVRSNDVNSLWRLCIIYGGFGADPDKDKELEYAHKAAALGDARAFMKLADLYPEKRVDYLTQAANAKHPDACFEMNELLAPAPKAHSYLITAALGGHMLAVFKLGLVYRFKKRSQLALRQFLEAASYEFAPAHDQLIQVLMELKDYTTALYWAMRVSPTPGVLFTTGRLYAELQQFEKALDCFTKSGTRDAKYYLAMMVMRGEGTAVDLVESNRLIHEAASEEQPGACLYLAVHYYFKMDDLEKGRKYLKLAEDRDVPEASLVAAQIKMEEGDRVGAAPLIVKAISSGLTHAHYLAALNALEDKNTDLAKYHLQTMLASEEDDQARKVLESL